MIHFLIVGMYPQQMHNITIPIIEAILSYPIKLLKNPAKRGPENSPREMEAEKIADDILVHLSY